MTSWPCKDTRPGGYTISQARDISSPPLPSRPLIFPRPLEVLDILCNESLKQWQVSPRRFRKDLNSTTPTFLPIRPLPVSTLASFNGLVWPLSHGNRVIRLAIKHDGSVISTNGPNNGEVEKSSSSFGILGDSTPRIVITKSRSITDYNHFGDFDEQTLRSFGPLGFSHCLVIDYIDNVCSAPSSSNKSRHHTYRVLI